MGRRSEQTFFQIKHTDGQQAHEKMLNISNNQRNSNKQASQLKSGQISEQTFFQRRHTDGQQAHEKMLNITNQQGTANQNYNEISHHNCQRATIKKNRNNKYW